MKTDPVINPNVSGNEILGITRVLSDMTKRIEGASKKLLVTWTAEEITRVHAATNGHPGSQTVHPDVAYALAAKSPTPDSAALAVTSLAEQHGGVIPLWKLGAVLGPWDSLIEELVVNRRRPR